MTFSKSFGYAIRGILYVMMYGNEKKNLQLDDIADTLNVHRFFLAKVLNKIVKAGILHSSKGHSGGFCINDTTGATTLYQIAECVGELTEFDTCVLRFRACNGHNPCPLHEKVEPVRIQWKDFLINTRVQDLVDSDPEIFLERIRIV